MAVRIPHQAFGVRVAVHFCICEIRTLDFRSAEFVAVQRHRSMDVVHVRERTASFHSGIGACRNQSSVSRLWLHRTRVGADNVSWMWFLPAS